MLGEETLTSMIDRSIDFVDRNFVTVCGYTVPVSGLTKSAITVVCNRHRFESSFQERSINASGAMSGACSGKAFMVGGTLPAKRLPGRRRYFRLSSTPLFASCLHANPSGESQQPRLLAVIVVVIVALLVAVAWLFDVSVGAD
jgi:hypothetical protein